MKAQSKEKAPNDFYDYKILTADLSVEELFVYVKVDAKLGMQKLRTKASLSPKKSISKKPKRSQGKSHIFSYVNLTFYLEDIYMNFINKLKEEILKCRDTTHIRHLGLTVVPDPKKFNTSTDEGAKDYLNQLELAIKATRSISCYLHYLKGIYFLVAKYNNLH